MATPPDYPERVYAGVLGKIIGVYLGRPFEGWSYERVTAELGEVWYYVNERLGRPLVTTDDDVSGTFTFLRALPDYDCRRDLSPAQIGQTWLNYLIERRTILWWGGLGNSTEHTAYLRLKHGVEAPRSGSIAQNGKVVAEQIGAQIFVDGWAMVAPGDPALAADLARRAASVSHDGEAIHGARVLAAMEAQAFVESNRDRLLDVGVSFIPRDSTIYRLIADLREWHAREPDWRTVRARLAATYGYDRYGGNCHIVPNHGVIILALLYGDDDFSKTLMIANTAGWDTDCNSGNVGCLLGIKNGLAGIDDGPDWRGPVADRLYLSAAGDRGITDAVREAYEICNISRTLAGEPPVAPKAGARFHFDLPGAVQGFRSDEGADARGTLVVRNVAGHSARGRRSLALRYRGVATGRVARASTPTFIPPEALGAAHYQLFASPTLYPGQTVRARLVADEANARAVTVGLFLRVYGPDDALVLAPGPTVALGPGAAGDLTWRIPDQAGAPIAEVGVAIGSDRRADGAVYLDVLTWDGVPDVTLGRPPHGGTAWRRAWIDGVDQCESRWPEPYRLAQNEGTGLLIQGARDWTDYQARTTITPHLAKAAGLAVRVQGMRRYYALLLGDDGKARLVKALDGTTVLAERDFPWELDTPYRFDLRVAGDRISAWIDGSEVFELRDPLRPLRSGGIALICEAGRLAADSVVVGPAPFDS